MAFPAQAFAVLRQAWQGGGPFCPWAPLYWLDTPDGEEADPDEESGKPTYENCHLIADSFEEFIEGLH